MKNTKVCYNLELSEWYIAFSYVTITIIGKVVTEILTDFNFICD